MRDSEILRQPLPIDLRRIPARQLNQFSPGLPPVPVLRWKSSPELGRQIERLPWHHARKGVIHRPHPEGLFDLLGAQRVHSLGKNVNNFLAQGCILGGCGNELFAGSLVKSDRMHFIPGHAPPARQDGAADQSRYQFVPDQSLDILGDDEILFGFCQNKRQIR